MIYSKKDKVELVKKILAGFDKFSSFTGLSRMSIAQSIRSFHFSSPFFVLFILAYGPLYMVIGAICFLLLIYTFFALFKGCILSRLESELLDDSFCITDPTLELLRMSLTNKNRYIISYIVGSIYLLTAVVIIYSRYFRKV